MMDDEAWDMAGGDLFGVREVSAAGDVAAIEHWEQDQPDHTALMHRAFATYTETMWIHAYRQARMVTITCPAVALRTGASACGVVFDVPVAQHVAADPAMFRQFFEARVSDYARQGWQLRPCEI